MLVWAEDRLLHGVNAVISSGADSNNAMLGFLGGDIWAGFGRELVQDLDLLLDLEDLQSKDEGMSPGSSHGFFRDRWGLLAVPVTWINAQQ